MKTTRIFQPGSYEVGQTVELSQEAGQHVGVVLRMQPGDTITLFSGDNHECQATILHAHKKKVTVRIKTIESITRESTLSIHLAQVISKGSRMEWVIQKAVELGVTSITPLTSERCVVRLDEARLEKKQLQWQAIAIAACEQSGRNQLPIIHPVIPLDVHLNQCDAPTKLILNPISGVSWRNIPLTTNTISLLIGPEGGLSEDEVKRALLHQFTALRLGPRILRTETATIAALSILQAAGGDL